MKILHIIDNLAMGGGQNLLIGLTRQQKHIGHEVTVLQLVNSSDPTVCNKIKMEGVKVIALSENGSVYNPFLIIKLLKYIKKYDIIHVHLFPALYWVGIANLLTFKSGHIIYTEHSTQNKRRGNPLLRITDRFIYNHCYNHIIACSQKALETFHESYPSVKHVSAINNGVDTSKYNASHPYTKSELLGISDDIFLVTMVARFMPMKRQDTIVEAISKLPEKFHACFVGSDANDIGLIKIKSLAETLRVSHRVHFLYIRADVDRILKTSDALIMSSEYEGLSLSSIEGMASCKPFIATDVNGLKEIVGGAGLLFELGNSTQLAEIISKLESDKSFYSQVATRCNERAKNYDLKITTELYLQTYSNL